MTAYTGETLPGDPITSEPWEPVPGEQDPAGAEPDSEQDGSTGNAVDEGGVSDEPGTGDGTAGPVARDLEDAA